MMDLVDHNLKNPFNHHKRLFRTQMMRQRRKPHHVTEHDGYLPSLTFNSVFLSQDFTRKAIWKVLLDSRQFFFKGKRID
jgi:hypothetical protein